MCSVLIKTYAVFPYAEKYTFLLNLMAAQLTALLTMFFRLREKSQGSPCFSVGFLFPHSSVTE